MTGPAEAPERRQLTVMFTDLVGSTDLASALDPEDWHDVLDAYQHRVATIVTAHGGVIAQFQGDGASRATSVIPKPRSRRVVTPLRRDWRSSRMSSDSAPSSRLSSGSATLRGAGGNPHGRSACCGRDRRGTRAPSRMCGARFPTWRPAFRRSGSPDTSSISGDTANLVAGFFELESLGFLTLKGIGHPVPAFRVLHRGSARHRLEARPLTPFIPRPEATRLAPGAVGMRAGRIGATDPRRGGSRHWQVARPPRVRLWSSRREATVWPPSSAADAVR